MDTSTQSHAPIPALPFELVSLSEAKRYQKWLIDAVRPFLGNRILELGSGIGNMSQHLPVREKLILSDIDDGLLHVLNMKFPSTDKTKVIKMEVGKSSLPILAPEGIDTVVSFNVLEHIDDDSALLREMIQVLRNSGATGPKRIVSIVPAHQWAFGKVDAQFGHFRRYSDKNFRGALRRAGVTSLHRRNYYSRYLNLPALMGWWLNGKLLGRDSIGTGNLKAFEALCPLIRPVDDFLHRALGLPFGNSLLTSYLVKDE